MLDLQKYETLKTTHKHAHLSPAYNFINTGDIISKFEERGWYPRTVKEVRTKVKDKIGYQKHLIRFGNMKETSLVKGNVLPEIVLRNAHDGSSAFALNIGLFRVVCSNGMMVSQGQLSSFSISHLHNLSKTIDATIDKLAEKLPYLKYQIEEMQALELDEYEADKYAVSALNLKYGGKAPLERIDRQLLLKSKRREDDENSLWNIFNRIQERFVNGGYYVQRQNGDVIHTKGIKNIQQNVHINEALWALNESYLQEVVNV